MRFAVDACVPTQLAFTLRTLGADVISAAGRPAMLDPNVLSIAVEEGRVSISTDYDFGEIVFRDGAPALGVIIIAYDLVSRLMVDETAARIAALPAGGAGFFTVVEAQGVRSRALPPPKPASPRP